MTTICLQIGTVIAGITLFIFTCRKFVKRKLTEELGICWVVLALLMILCGCLPGCFIWGNKMKLHNGILILSIGYLLLLIAFYISVLITGLLRKNQELAIIVSLLNQENETLKQQMITFRELTTTSEDKDEKETTICN